MTKNLLFFMRPAEFSSLCWELAGRLGLTLLSWRAGRGNAGLEALRPGGAVAIEDSVFRESVFFAEGDSELERADLLDLRPGELGWVMCGLPREAGRQLLLCQMGAKTDWVDPNSGSVMENPAALYLFRKLAPAFRKRLKFPVWACNVVTGGADSYWNMGFSRGAEEWVRDGGELRQEGVQNVRFFIEPPAPVSGP